MPIEYIHKLRIRTFHKKALAFFAITRNDNCFVWNAIKTEYTDVHCLRHKATSNDKFTWPRNNKF